MPKGITRKGLKKALHTFGKGGKKALKRASKTANTHDVHLSTPKKKVRKSVKTSAPKKKVRRKGVGAHLKKHQATYLITAGGIGGSAVVSRRGGRRRKGTTERRIRFSYSTRSRRR